jgi:NADPH:quinone reductase-like Zn-dependent oxidoreductase
LAALKAGADACLTGFLAADWDEGVAKYASVRLGIALHRFRSSVINVESFGAIFQSIVDGIENGRYNVNLDRTFPLIDISDAHRYMEDNRATGKVVGLP